jgi:hypothetical protein
MPGGQGLRTSGDDQRASVIVRTVAVVSVGYGKRGVLKDAYVVCQSLQMGEI